MNNTVDTHSLNMLSYFKRRNNMIKVQCPQCGSKVVIAKRDNSSWCRRCGWKGNTKETIAKKDN